MRRIYLHCLVLTIFLVSSDCTKEKTSLIGHPQVKLNVNIEHGTNTSARGYPVMIDVNISNTPTHNSLYVHLFQKENQMSEYYYQSSTAIIGSNSTASLPVWFGAPNDINKDYEIFVVINDKPSYPKDANGIHKFQTLPSTVVAKTLVHRVQ